MYLHVLAETPSLTTTDVIFARFAYQGTELSLVQLASSPDVPPPIGWMVSVPVLASNFHSQVSDAVQPSVGVTSLPASSPSSALRDSSFDSSELTERAFS